MVKLKLQLSDKPAIFSPNDIQYSISRINQAIETCDNHELDGFISNDLHVIPTDPIRPVLYVGDKIINQKDNIYPSFPYRFRPDILALEDSLRSGQLGIPGSVRIHYWSDSPIKNYTKIGMIDLAQRIFRDTPNCINKLGNKSTNEIIHLGFRSGGMCVMDFATIKSQSESYFSLHIIGSDGAAYVDDHHNRNLFFNEHNYKSQAINNNALTCLNQLEEFQRLVTSKETSYQYWEDYQNAKNVLEYGGLDD